MPKRSNSFQTLIYQIQKHVAHDGRLTVIESKGLRNAATGKLREVDIVIEGELADVPLVISFECTALKSRADATWVEKMTGKHQNLPTNQLILVSKSGFTEQALTLAANTKNVEAVTLDDAVDVDWAAYMAQYQKLRFDTFESTPTSMDAHYSRLSPSDPALVLQPSTIVRRLADGIELDVRAFAKDILGSPKARDLITRRWLKLEKPNKTTSGTGQFSMNWRPEPNTFAICEGSIWYPIESLDIKATLVVKSTPVRLDPKSFMGTHLAYVELEKPFTTSDPERGDKVILAITKRQDGKMRASVSFPEARSAKRKVTVFDFTGKEAEAAKG